MKTQKILILVLALVMLFALAGCPSSDPVPPDLPAPTEEELAANFVSAQIEKMQSGLTSATESVNLGQEVGKAFSSSNFTLNLESVSGHFDENNNEVIDSRFNITGAAFDNGKACIPFSTVNGDGEDSEEESGKVYIWDNAEAKKYFLASVNNADEARAVYVDYSEGDWLKDNLLYLLANNPGSGGIPGIGSVEIDTSMLSMLKEFFEKDFPKPTRDDFVGNGDGTLTLKNDYIKRIAHAFVDKVYEDALKELPEEFKDAMKQQIAALYEEIDESIDALNLVVSVKLGEGEKADEIVELRITVESAIVSDTETQPAQPEQKLSLEIVLNENSFFLKVDAGKIVFTVTSEFTADKFSLEIGGDVLSEAEDGTETAAGLVIVRFKADFKEYTVGERQVRMPVSAEMTVSVLGAFIEEVAPEGISVSLDYSLTESENGFDIYSSFNFDAGENNKFSIGGKVKFDKSWRFLSAEIYETVVSLDYDNEATRVGAALFKVSVSYGDAVVTLPDSEVLKGWEDSAKDAKDMFEDML